MAVSTVDDTLDDKDPWPEPPVMPAPPGNCPLGQWSTHLAAFDVSGHGAPARMPIVTVLTPDHASAPAQAGSTNTSP
jgi:hypothetical protein